MITSFEDKYTNKSPKTIIMTRTGYFLAKSSGQAEMFYWLIKYPLRTWAILGFETDDCKECPFIHYCGI